MTIKFDPTLDKCAILVDDSLALGYAANAVSVVAMSLGKMVDNLIGPHTTSSDSVNYPGVIYSPLPILVAKASYMTELHHRLKEDSSLLLMPFSSLAQSCKTYQEYGLNMSVAASAEIHLVALGIVGDKKKVNKYTGNLALFR
jgi:hypothetical protein